MSENINKFLCATRALTINTRAKLINRYKIYKKVLILYIVHVLLIRDIIFH